MTTKIFLALALMSISCLMIQGYEIDPDLRRFENIQIDSIQFKKNKTASYIIKRELETLPGTFFSIETMEEDLKRLEKLDLFSSVKVNIEKIQSNNLLITFIFHETIWFLAYPNPGYTEENGIEFGVGAKTVNLFFRDISLSLSTNFYGTRSIDFEFDWPWISFNHLSFYSYIIHQERDNILDNFKEKFTQYQFRMGSYFSKTLRWTLESENMFMQNLRILDFSNPIHQNQVGTYRNITLTGSEDHINKLSVSLIYDSRDSYRNPLKGSLNEVKFIHAGGFLGGDAHFSQLEMSCEKYFYVSEKQTFLAAILSDITFGKPGVDFPYYLDYHIGGVNSVRGYYSDHREQLYGKNQFLLTLEYRYTLFNHFELSLYQFHISFGMGMSLFLDSGTASSSISKYFSSTWRHGIGFGINFLVPYVDIIRIEFAINEEKGFFFSPFSSYHKSYMQKKRIK